MDTQVIRMVVSISTHTLARRVTSNSYLSKSLQTISTHTLARRVTNLFAQIEESLDISTHTLARRVTKVGSRNAVECLNFNPHPRTEGDTAYWSATPA